MPHTNQFETTAHLLETSFGPRVLLLHRVCSLAVLWWDLAKGSIR